MGCPRGLLKSHVLQCLCLPGITTLSQEEEQKNKALSRDSARHCTYYSCKRPLKTATKEKKQEERTIKKKK